MEEISTVIILRELDKRLYDYKQGDPDTFISFMCDLDEQSVVDLDNAITSVLESYTEYQISNILDGEKE